jgi:hypothetical protein
MAIERREGTSTGSDIVHSFAEDNVERGEPGVDFVKRKPTYPIGDDPRGREINFEADAESGEAYGSTRNLVFRAYRQQAPLEGQNFNSPSRISALQGITDIRPELPNRSVDAIALDRAKEIERGLIEASGFSAIYPRISIDTPSPGASFSPGSRIEIRVSVASIRSVFSAVLFVDGSPVERKTLDRREQEVTTDYQFIFLYDIPANRPFGPLSLTARGFNITTSAQNFIADDRNVDPSNIHLIQTGVGTLDGRLGQSQGSQSQPPLLEATSIQLTPEAVSSITINVV